MSLISAVLLVRAGLTLNQTEYSPASLLSSISMAVAWMLAVVLNRFEHCYRIRSSSVIFSFYLFSFITGAITARSLNELTDSSNLQTILYGIYLILITIGFVFEAWPRGTKQIQQNSTANSYEKANIFSRSVFHYLQHLITEGYRRPLQPKDIEGMMPQRIKTQMSYIRIAEQWEDHVEKQRDKGSKPFLFGLVLISFGFRQWVNVVTLRIIASGLAFLAPLLMSSLLDFIESYETESPQPIGVGIVLALGMFFSTSSSSIVSGQFNQQIIEMGLEARTALVSMIYRKSLLLSPTSRQIKTSGEINNHMSVDCARWDRVFPLLPFCFSIPLEISLATWLLYRQLGWSSFGGIGTIILMMPIQSWVGNQLSRAKEETLTAMDNRVRLINEAITGIKIIKLYGWESSFLNKIAAFRNIELAATRRVGILSSIINVPFSSMSFLMTLTSLSLYATIGGPGFTPGIINSKTIFVSITLFGLIDRPIGMISFIMGNTISLNVSTRRIQDFLLSEELPYGQIEKSDELPCESSTAPIIISNSTFGWKKEQQQSNILLDDGSSAHDSGISSTNPTLKNITLCINRGSLTAIVGRVGQGKSSLLGAMMGEMYKWRGAVQVSGRIAYVPQQAWIINATLQDNIIFGASFDKKKYDQIIYACGLNPDIEVLPAGDQTEIGERGINLSGGQKQRVSLARAAYQDSDIYLLDDPLSAVDAHVDQHLWQNLIGPSGLLKDKTRILVTHGIHHLSEMDQIIVMKDGEINETGEYHELLEAKNAFYQLIQDYSVAYMNKDVYGSNSKGVDEIGAGSSSTLDHDTKVEGDFKKDNRKAELIEKETIEAGSIELSTYKTFIKAAGYGSFIQIASLFIFIQACQMGSNIWLRNWIRISDISTHSIGYFMGIYAALIVVFMVLILCASYKLMATACVQASNRLHSALLHNILHLPMSFFDITPLGRILNRFSSDMANVDDMIRWAVYDIFLFGVTVVGSLVVITMTTPIFLVIVPPIIVMYIMVMIYYTSASRAFKRIESITRSPLYQHFSETVTGVSTIRVAGCGSRFINDNASRSDDFSNAHFVWAMGNLWLNVRLECLGSMIVLGASVFAVFARDSLNPAMVGMSLTYALTITQDISWLVRGICESQYHLVSVERIDEYSKKNQEAPNFTDVEVPENWPSKGHLSFKNYSTRYRQGMDLVLRNVSFEVQPGEKVGIVGRTGAGKSSLTLALFRIIEAANSHWAKASHNGADMDEDPSKAEKITEMEKVEVEEDGGSIWIDGVDISTIGLEQLRQHLAIIPQDPTLFVGTIRENLDPFDQASDTELWEALDRAHLKDYISSMPGGLSYEVTQNGDNFSVGQRSLICLARALLRKTKILVLDEATAAVDVETDELIQRTIRSEFKDRTILTIAHRIKTVMDSDKILVLEKGRVEEFESPNELLKRKESLFYRLAVQTGEL
ncbi:hypothetical protein FBU30_008066 [Linnemannia zychae]|nr:hypothetical protein FBU30_008066 [Linnemannia zychae]